MFTEPPDLHPGLADPAAPVKAGFSEETLTRVEAIITGLTEEERTIICGGLDINGDGLTWGYGDGSGPIVTIPEETRNVIAFIFDRI